LHVAGALGVPSIGLYGPHTYETRGLYFPTQRPVFLVDDTDDRCPCYTHADQQDEQIPCGEKHCRLMAGISPAHVFKVASEVLDAQLSKRHSDAKGKRLRKGADVGK
jgi:ADP-heptose:LPS heptosyltransferase